MPNAAYGLPVAVTLPADTRPRGNVSRLYKLADPTRPNGVPSGRFGLSFPSFATGSSRAGSSTP
jgi:hypothetical protein